MGVWADGVWAELVWADNVWFGLTSEGGGLSDPPVADAGPPQSVAKLALGVQLDGSGSTDDVGITSYSWTQTQGTAVTLSDPNIVNPTFDAPNADEVLQFELTVTDGDSQTDVGAVNITVGAGFVSATVQRRRSPNVKTGGGI